MIPGVAIKNNHSLTLILQALFITDLYQVFTHSLVYSWGEVCSWTCWYLLLSWSYGYLCKKYRIWKITCRTKNSLIFVKSRYDSALVRDNWTLVATGFDSGARQLGSRYDSARPTRSRDIASTTSRPTDISRTSRSNLVYLSVFSQCKKLDPKSRVGFRSFYRVSEIRKRSLSPCNCNCNFSVFRDLVVFSSVT